MVTKVTQETREAIDWYLVGLARKWDGALDAVRHWDKLSRSERIEIDAEWPLAVDYLERLLIYQRDGMFSPEQERTFQKLRKFMRAHEHELETVLGPGGVMLDPPLD